MRDNQKAHFILQTLVQNSDLHFETLIMEPRHGERNKHTLKTAAKKLFYDNYFLLSNATLARLLSI